jgi:hypothetical protein
MANKARIYVWCEDRRQEQFARRLLAEVLQARPLRFYVAPAGEGSASTWVLRQFEAEVVRMHRQNRHQTSLGFLVLIDGDQLGPTRRLEHMKRDSSDRIAVLVPRT